MSTLVQSGFCQHRGLSEVEESFCCVARILSRKNSGIELLKWRECKVETVIHVMNHRVKVKLENILDLNTLNAAQVVQHVYLDTVQIRWRCANSVHEVLEFYKDQTARILL